MPNSDDVSKDARALIARIARECPLNPNLDAHALNLRAVFYSLRLQRIDQLNERELEDLNNNIIGTNDEMDRTPPAVHVHAVPLPIIVPDANASSIASSSVYNPFQYDSAQLRGSAAYPDDHSM